jgi:uncharacterized protein YbjQ (UPF0145 family)
MLLMAAASVLAACGTYAVSSVQPVGTTPSTFGPTKTVAKADAPTPPALIVVTENDITDRPYKSLGDISVTVKKVTIFDQDPTREKVAEALRQEASKLGADAVVLVRYGTVGIGLFSWGQIDGQGRAVAFQK